VPRLGIRPLLWRVFSGSSRFPWFLLAVETLSSGFVSVGWRLLVDPKVGVVILFFAVLTDLSYKWLLYAVISPLVLFASLLGALLSVPFPGGKRVDVPLGGLGCRLFRLIVGSLRSTTGEVPIYRCIYAEVVGFGL